MSVELKDNSYLTLAEVKEWLNVTGTSYDDRITRLINTACRLVESYIDGPVITRTFTETRDGNNANSIVLGHRPVREITSLKVDYNRSFGASSELLTSNYVLRGPADLAQTDEDVEIRILGQDVVLVDDTNTAILGRLFSGSSIQSIRVVYTAGWGDSEADLPDDLIHATFMLVEYYYHLRDNRDVGISSRTNQGQSYSRHRTDNTAGIPDEIRSLLDPYRDVSLGSSSERMQNNSFTV